MSAPTATNKKRRAPRSSGRSTRNIWSITAVGALAAAAQLGPAPVSALDVQPPAEWVQCQPATVNFRSEGNVSILIRLPTPKSKKLDTHTVARVGVGASSWTWPAVDLLAGTEFTLSIHDDVPWNSTTRSNKDVANLGHFVSSEKVTLPVGAANDTACIAPEKPKSSKKKQRGKTEVAVIAGVLGGILLALLGLLAIVIWRRRHEAKAAGHDSWLDHGSAAPAGGDGSSTNQANGGSAGWKYMSRLVPGLAPAAPGSHVPGAPAAGEAGQRGGGRRARRARRNRVERISDFDPELPSYGHSQSDAKLLPKYANGVAPTAEEYDLPTVAHRQEEMGITVEEQQYHQRWDQRGPVTRASDPMSPPPSFADPRARPHPNDVFADPPQPQMTDIDSARHRMPYGAWPDSGAGMGIAESQVNLVGDGPGQMSPGRSTGGGPGQGGPGMLQHGYGAYSAAGGGYGR